MGIKFAIRALSDVYLIKHSCSYFKYYLSIACAIGPFFRATYICKRLILSVAFVNCICTMIYITKGDALYIEGVLITF